MSRLFPELDGRARPAPAAKGTAPSGTHSTIVGGRRCLRALTRTLALPGPLRGNPPCTIETAALDPSDGLRIVAKGGGLPETIFWLQPRGRSPVWRETVHLSVTYRGVDLSPAQETLLDWVSRAVEPLRFADLERIVHMDPSSFAEVTSETLPDAPRQTGDRALSHLVYGFGAGEAWLTFFADNELERGDASRFLGRHVHVHHTELECNYGSIPPGEDALSFFAFPSTDPAWRKRAGKSVAVITDLDDLDVIRGGGERLDRVLAETIVGTEAQLISVGTSCTPQVTGDDVEGSIAKLQEKTDAPVLFVGNERNLHARLIELWGSEPRVGADAPEPRSVDIVGLPPQPGHEALLLLLEDAGIHVRTTIIPDIDPDELRDFGRAAVQVYYRTDRHAAAYAALRKARPGRAIAPPLPFGVEGTRRWLQAICVALGMVHEGEQAWQRAFERLQPRWERAQGHARRHRLGFVLDRLGLARLERSCRVTGLPLLALLAEIGFGFEILVHDPSGDGVTVAGVESRLEGLDAHVTPYGTREDLEDAMRRSRAAAFYSELTLDPRPARAGKARFSAAEVGIGLLGAVDTAERMVALCRMTFFRSYRDQLGGLS